MNVYVTPNNLDIFVIENIDRIEESIIVLAESDDGLGEITITSDPEMPFELRCEIDGKSVTEITENPAEVYGKFFESLKEYDSLEIKPEPEEEIEEPEEEMWDCVEQFLDNLGIVHRPTEMVYEIVNYMTIILSDYGFEV